MIATLMHLAFFAGLVLVALGQQSATFSNPVLWEDLADNEVIRVDDAYYFTASTMHYSPGAPVLRSYDLVNWEYIGHSVPTLSWSPAYDLAGGQRAYVKGIWASTLKYRTSNKKWYWLGCIQSTGKTYVYTASSPSGPWSQASAINTCYYDAGLLIDDDDDTMYVAYGNTRVSVAKLSSDGLSEVSKKEVYSTPGSIGTLEGSRFYKKNGFYYIFMTRPANGQYILRSKSPFGSYEIKELALNMPSPVSGSGYPHQGSLVDTPDGKWYYMAFIDA
jgi:beta-xylosidase